jgi:hypothetical protein
MRRFQRLALGLIESDDGVHSIHCAENTGKPLTSADLETPRGSSSTCVTTPSGSVALFATDHRDTMGDNCEDSILEGATHEDVEPLNRSQDLSEIQAFREELRRRAKVTPPRRRTNNLNSLPRSATAVLDESQNTFADLQETSYD